MNIFGRSSTSKRQCTEAPDKFFEEGKGRKGVRIESAIRLNNAHVCISSGSVVKFSGDAIVNAANNGGLGGGGVDGAVNAIGGPTLVAAREALPLVKGNVRIPTGEAVVTIGGNLPAKKVIHAVGPNYMSYRNEAEADELLLHAYQNSMRVADEEENVSSLGFSLLSSGIFRGSRSLEAVLEIGCRAIFDSLCKSGSACSSLKEVHLIAFNEKELKALLKVAKRVFANPPDSMEATCAKDDPKACRDGPLEKDSSGPPVALDNADLSNPEA